MLLIDELDDTINGAKSGLIGSQVKVDKAQAYGILDQMRATIPEEIKQARWIVKERQEMLAEAKREAERIIREAREEQIRLGAEDYADDILNTLEVNLTKFIAAVQRGRDRLQGREEAEVGSRVSD